VRRADRSLRQTNPVLGVVARVIELAGERLTASQVLDLADREPVRRRFGLDDDDLARFEQWIRAGGIRWGLDQEHRAPFRLETIPNGTWRAGLDRLLLGVTMTEDGQRLFERTLPLDDVESGAIELAGTLAELVDRLAAAVDALRGPQPVADWIAAVAGAADALTAPAPRDAWQRAELQRILDDVLDEAGGSTTELGLDELRDLLADRLRGRPTRANFRTGALTVCTLVPMRSVPHRVVCLLGLDDGSFPRKSPRDGDDLTLADPHVGERDGRTEDRQLLLDALMSATDTLLITYTGNDERTNLPRTPAVPVGELLDALEALGTSRDDVVTRHPLQPFDERNFRAGALATAGPWSFDAVTLRGARALGGRREPRPPFLAAPLPALTAPLVELDDLVRFAERPVQAFLARRLELWVGELDSDVEDRLPVKLGGLEAYAVGDRLLQAIRAGIDERTAALAEIARGSLPPSMLGRPVIDDALPRAREIAAAVPADASASLDVRVALPGGRTLRGTVAGLAGDTLVTATYARVRSRQRIGAWVRLLALTAAHPGREFDALTVGRARTGEGIARFRIPPLDAGEARDHLTVLLDLYDRGMRVPPPLYPETSLAYARAALAGDDAPAAARAEWQSEWAWDREDRSPEHVLVLGGERAFGDLYDDPPGPDEHGPFWDTSEPRRLGRWALRLWAPLLGREQT
jgi:exodeoxyribonuclease V gamma subunit